MRSLTPNWQWNVAVAFLAFVISFQQLSRSGLSQDDISVRDRVLEEKLNDFVSPLLTTYCIDCHQGESAEAEIDFDREFDLEHVRSNIAIWQKTLVMLETRQMPPSDAAQLDETERTQFREWLQGLLSIEAAKRAGDPGPVILRRLSNSEYTYSLRDLTGIDSLNPAEQFPVDGASGEGFTNSGSGLVMSPTLLTKYLDAAKEVSEHLVLLPDGIRFSKGTSQQDWTNEYLAEIREFYGKHTGGNGNQIPVLRYLAALEESPSEKELAMLADSENLKHAYLLRLFNLLESPSGVDSSGLLGKVRREWDSENRDPAKIAASIANWQGALWTFNTIGHIGREGGPDRWMQAVSPLATEMNFDQLIPEDFSAETVTIELWAGDAGDGSVGDVVHWRNPRLVDSQGNEIPFSHVNGIQDRWINKQKLAIEEASKYLDALADRIESDDLDLAKVAKDSGLNQSVLELWANFLKVGRGDEVRLTGHFQNKLGSADSSEAIIGWGSGETPSITTNRTDEQLRVPGIAEPHSVMLHPSPTAYAAVAWQAPVSDEFTVSGSVRDAHPECGNGVEWMLVLHTRFGRQQLATGVINTAQRIEFPTKRLSLKQGEAVSLVIGPRDGNHFCDLTQIELRIKSETNSSLAWDLANEIADRVQESNPLADALGNPNVWHLCSGDWQQLRRDADDWVEINSDSLLAKWIHGTGEQRKALSQDIATSLLAATTSGDLEVAADSKEASWIKAFRRRLRSVKWQASEGIESDERFGLQLIDGVKQERRSGSENDLWLQAPGRITFDISPELLRGRRLVASAVIDSDQTDSNQGSVQVNLGIGAHELSDVDPEVQFLVVSGGEGEERVRQSMDEFRDLFPATLCYSQIVPVDEVVTLILFYREDDALRRLMLSEEETNQLEQLWKELLYVTQEPLKRFVAFEQLSEFATQDRPDLVKAFEPLREPLRERAEKFRIESVELEPHQVEALLDWTARAWRRPLTSSERSAFRGFYQELREEGLEHQESMQMTLARILTSPHFLYRRETQPEELVQGQISNFELATRLSYFLWSSVPDDELWKLAEQGQLQRESVLAQQVERMLKDKKTERLAIEFACQWLQLRDFDQNDEKNEALYPEFASLREPMYQEVVLYFEDMFRNNGSILGLIESDFTFLNEELATFYGIDGVEGEQWRRVEGMKSYGRGGLLGMASLLAKQSGASRPSAILRGNFVVETLLGEPSPKPPKNVPVLPDTLPEGLTARELVEQHRAAPGCAKCHDRIDPYGLALEQFNAIGRRLDLDVDTATTLPSGEEIDGLIDLQTYLKEERGEEITREFCKKLLGYALGRETQLSDQVLLDEMVKALKEDQYLFHHAVQLIVASRPFREIRGADWVGNSE